MGRFDYSKTICWDCRNCYANKCEKFHTDEPLTDIWDRYEEFKIKSINAGCKYIRGYVVYECKNFQPDEKPVRDSKNNIRKKINKSDFFRN